MFSALCAITYADDSGARASTATPSRVAAPIGSGPLSESDKDWAEIRSEAMRGGDKKYTPDWDLIEQKAKAFRLKHPTDRRAAESRKLELKAGLKREYKKGERLEDVQAAVAAYLGDRSVPASDRFDISALVKEHEMGRFSGKTRQLRDEKRTAHARQLISEFSDDARGYGYLLSIAKGQPGRKAQELAEEILKSSAPETIKKGAQRLVEQRELEGKILAAPGLPLSEFKGVPVIIYSWSTKRPEIFKRVDQWSKISGLGIIGINLDEDSDTARKLVETVSVPGKHLYETKGMEGPLATQLKFTMASSVYLVDADGILRDVSGYEDTVTKVTKLIGNATEDKK